MNMIGKLTAAALLATAGALALATTASTEEGITLEQAIEMARQARPGTVEEVERDTKDGVAVWEVKIKGDDGQKWELYYSIADGKLVKEEKDD